MTWLFVALIIAIVASLFSALLTLMKSKEPSTRMVKALTIRVGLSILLFIILIAFKSGFQFH